MFKTLSVIVPVYNEKNTIEECLDRVINSNTCGLELEIIVSDNNSNDGSKEILKSINNSKVKCFFKEKNEGKGSNIINGLKHANGDLILFQDADLEYHPENYPELIKPFLENNADVVYGSRLTGSKTTKILGIFHLAAQASVPLSLKNFYRSSLNNLASAIKVFDLSRKYSIPVVYASSSAIYGNLPLGNDKIDKFSISSPYAQDKLTIEHYAKMSFKLFKTSSIGLRFFNVYGPGQSANSPYSSVIPIFIYKMLKKLPITINGGFQTRDFVYVDDVVDVMIKSMEKLQRKKDFKFFNFGTGRSVKI